MKLFCKFEAQTHIQCKTIFFQYYLLFYYTLPYRCNKNHMDEPNNQSKELQIVQEFQSIYSPSTILGVFANALKSPVEGRMILAKGIYQTTQNSKEYSGYYYDEIKSPNDNKYIKAKIPSLVRSKLENNSIYLFKGYVEKRVGFSTIELVYVVDEVLQKEENQISDEDYKRFEVLQKKVSKGYRDLEYIIKESVHKNKPFRIVNIYGSTSIVPKDFEKGIAESTTRYIITDSRCNLSSKSEILNQLRKHNNSQFDAIALVRGGGDKAAMEVLNDSEIAEEILKLQPLFISALGHVVNECLIDKVADKKFHLPFDYGNSLKTYVDDAVTEQSKSKSLFIEQVKKDLTKTFEDQIKTKDEALKNLQKSYEENSKQLVKMATAEMQTKFDAMKVENSRLNEQLKQSSQTGSNLIIWIIVALAIGLAIGFAISQG